MININTINRLERLGIGPNIDKLEYHATLMNYAEQIGFKLFSEEEKQEINELLHELKPSAKIIKSSFSQNDTIIANLDDIDSLFMPGSYIGYKSVEENNKKEISKFNSYININGSNIFAYALPLGIKIRVIYKYGKLERACIFNMGDKGKDITYLVKELFASYIDGLEHIEYVELKCIIANTLDRYIEDLELLKLIIDESRYDITSFKVYIYDIRVSDIELNEKEYIYLFEQFNKYKFNNFGINNIESITVALINNIKAEDMGDAIHQLKEHFIGLKEFNIKELIITVNNNRDEDAYICIDFKNKINDSNKIYEATVTNIKWIQTEEYCYPRLIINPVRLDNKDIIDFIELRNLKQLVNKNIRVSNKIRFKLDKNNNYIIV